MTKVILVIAVLALILSVVAVMAPKEVIVEKPIIIELPAPVVEDRAEDNITMNVVEGSITPHSHTLTTTYRYYWVESDGYHQWKNSVKTEDKYLPSHFGLGGSLSSSGHWERR